MKNCLYSISLFILFLILPSVACNIGVTINPDFSATESALQETQTALETTVIEKNEFTTIPTSHSAHNTSIPTSIDDNKPTPTITPEWLVPQTSIYLTQIEMPPREQQKPGATAEFKIHYGNWSNVSIPEFDIICLLQETEQIATISNITLEPTLNGLSVCSLTLPYTTGSYTIQVFLDPNHSIENREDGEITMTNSGYIE